MRLASPRAWNARSTLCTVWVLQPTVGAIAGARSPRALASRIWQRRSSKAADERSPASSRARSCGVTGRTKVGGRIPEPTRAHQRPRLRMH